MNSGKIWILYSEIQDSPVEAQFFTTKDKARFAGLDRVIQASALPPGSRVEWRPAEQSNGVPKYNGPMFGLAYDPADWPDYEALWEILPDGTESAYWQLDSALLDDAEYEPGPAGQLKEGTS
jgi:hypothetical protein